MKNVKKFILSLSGLALCCVASGSVLSTVNASAEEVNNTVNTVNFQMTSGASIRIDANTQDGKDENGIRYQIKMPDSEYKALESNSAYDSVSYGILIAPNEYVTKYGALDKANVFGKEAVYDWAVKNENGNWVYEGDGSKTRIMNFESDILSPWSKDETVRTYFGSIVNLDETNLPRDFVGVGYIKYTKDGVTDYVFAQANDNVRSMSQVARLAYADTSANALDQTTKDELKKTYIDDVFGNSFEFDSAKDAYLSVNDKNASIVTDGNVKGLKATVSQIKNNQGRQDLRINVGGEYQFKDIEKIVIRYKVTVSNNDGWWRLFFNDNTTEGQQLVNNTGVTYSTQTGRDSGVMSDYATITIDPSVANSKTGLTSDDYFYAINIGYRDSADRTMTMIIDSVVVYTGYKAEYLNFNESAAVGLALSGANTTIVSDGTVTGLQGTFTQTSSGARNDLKVNVGGEYQFKQIQKIVIKYKVTESNNNGWWRLFFNNNTTEGQQLVNNTGVTYSTQTGRDSGVMSDYGTVTIEPSLANSKTGLSGEDYFSTFSFGYRDSVNRTLTMIIDSVEIYVYENMFNFADNSALSLVSGLDVSLVEDAGCTDGKGVKGSFARDDKNSQSLKINFGGVYKIAEIEKIVIRYKMTEGNNGWYRLYANGKKDNDAYRLQSPNIVFASSTSSQAKPMNDYSTITINQAAFTASAGPALAETATLNSLEFWFGGWQNSSGSTSTLIIDSITIVLK